MDNKPIHVRIGTARAVAPRVQWVIRDGRLYCIETVATSAPNATITIGKEVK